jgi:transcriptional regulator with XRE-family HTH domain
MVLGQRIKQLRELRAMNQLDLARQVGLTRQTLAKLEDDPAQNPKLDNLRRIASVLEVSVAYLIGEGYPVPEKLRQLALENGLPYRDLDHLILMTFEEKESTTPEEWRHLLRASQEFPNLYKRLGRIKENGKRSSH